MQPPIPRPVPTLHGLAAFLVIALGLTYLGRPSIMPYHLDALGTTWSALPAAHRTLYLAFFKGVGAGYLAAGIAQLVLVLVPMRRGERWTLWATPLVAFVGMVPLAGIILFLRSHSAAEPPLIYPMLVMGLSAAGIGLSLFDRTRHQHAPASHHSPAR